MRALHRLSAAFVESARRGRAKPGKHLDGGHLSLYVSKTGSASWVFKYERSGIRKEVGLGSLALVTLTAARKKAAELRANLGAGMAPLPARVRFHGATQGLTFAHAAAAHIKSRSAEFKNAKHIAQWTSTLEQYAFPVLENVDVNDIETPHILAVLNPIWTKVPETASRVRGRIESVLAYATAAGYRTADKPNPARWKGHLAAMLAKPSKVKHVEHHAALPYAELPAFMKKLRAEIGMGAMALEFAILTATRTNEVIGARFQEFDLDAATWIIPADRMKARKEHRVPLSKSAVALIKKLGEAGCEPGGFVFTGLRQEKPLSNMAMLATLKRMKRSDLTTHGFRSTFRDWAGETTAHPREVIEHALAHLLKDKSEAAYQRGTLMAKRKELMDDWAGYIDGDRKA